MLGRRINLPLALQLAEVNSALRNRAISCEMASLKDLFGSVKLPTVPLGRSTSAHRKTVPKYYMR